MSRSRCKMLLNQNISHSIFLKDLLDMQPTLLARKQNLTMTSQFKCQSHSATAPSKGGFLTLGFLCTPI